MTVYDIAGQYRATNKAEARHIAKDVANKEGKAVSFAWRVTKTGRVEFEIVQPAKK